MYRWNSFSFGAAHSQDLYFSRSYIIYSDEDADMYETNLMRRLSGLLYLDPKVVGDIKEKVRQKKI